MTNPYRLMLKPEPDGMGFLYGSITDTAGNSHRVDIMPPIAFWRGSLKPEGDSAPHPSDWVIYVDGSEIARVSKRGDIEPVIARQLSAR
jgi:hypothetical protein